MSGARTATLYDAAGRITAVRSPNSQSVTMAYNGDNRRILLVQGTSTTKFVWAPVIDAYIQELNGSNVLVASYTNEPQQYGGVLSQRRGSTSRFLHADALGTTRLLTSTAGATTDTYLLDAWGNPVSSTSSTVSPFRWVGRYGYYTDNATGLFYVWARMYQPMIARWSNADPLFLIRTLSNTVRQFPGRIRIDYVTNGNVMAYANGTPTRFIDPSGLCDIDVPFPPPGPGVPRPVIHVITREGLELSGKGGYTESLSQIGLQLNCDCVQNAVGNFCVKCSLTADRAPEIH